MLDFLKKIFLLENIYINLIDLEGALRIVIIFAILMLRIMWLVRDDTVIFALKHIFQMIMKQKLKVSPVIFFIIYRL